MCDTVPNLLQVCVTQSLIYYRYAMARDGALPGSSYIAYIFPATRSPVNCVFAVFILNTILLSIGVYAHVCWRMLTHADVCFSRLYYWQMLYQALLLSYALQGFATSSGLDAILSICVIGFQILIYYLIYYCVLPGFATSSGLAAILSICVIGFQISYAIPLILRLTSGR